MTTDETTREAQIKSSLREAFSCEQSAAGSDVAIQKFVLYQNTGLPRFLPRFARS
jgi:hypothetical protein